jgi:hypothetical protein
VILERGPRRDHDRTAPESEARPVELEDRAVDPVAVFEVALAQREFALEVGFLEQDRSADEEAVQDERLISQRLPLGVGRYGVGAGRHRVLISHEERNLLVVRPSVGVRAPAEGCFHIGPRT